MSHDINRAEGTSSHASPAHSSLYMRRSSAPVLRAAGAQLSPAATERTGAASPSDQRSLFWIYRHPAKMRHVFVVIAVAALLTGGLSGCPCATVLQV